MNLRQKLENNNLLQKIISVGIAILLWSFVMGVVNPEISKDFRDIPVRIEGLDRVESRGMTYMEPIEPQVDVRISGPRSDLVDLNIDNIQVSANIGNLEPGSSRVPIEISLRNFYGRVNINQLNPEYLDVVVDTIETITLPIDVEIDGDLKEGYIFGDVEPVTKEVEISMPSQVIDEAYKAKAILEVDEDRTESFVTSSAIIIENRNGEVVEQIDIEPKTVDIEVPIYQIKSVPVELEFQGRMPEDQAIEDIEIEPRNVVVSGPSNVISELDSIKTKAIDYNNLLGRTSINAELNIPDALNLHEERNVVKITYSLRDTISKNLEIPIEDIEIRNAEDSLTYQIEEEGPIEVELVAEASAIEDMTEEDVNLFVDVGELSPGSYQVYIRTDENHVGLIEPNRVNIVVSPLED